MNSTIVLNPVSPAENAFATRKQSASSETSSMRRPAPGIWEALLWTFAFLAMTQIIPAGFLAIMSTNSSGELELRKDLLLPSLLIGQILGICLTVSILRIRVGRDWSGAIQFRRPSLRLTLLAVACLPALLLIGFAVENQIEHLIGEKEPTTELVLLGMAYYPMWFYMLVLAVGPSINEELFCRGFIGRGLVGRFGISAGMLLTSAIFGAIHLNLPQGIWAFILGCFLHLGYLATRSVWVPLLLHFLNNFIAVLVTSALEDYQPTTGQLVLLTLICFTIAIPSAWALYRMQANAEPNA